MDGVNASMQDSQGDLFNECPDCWVRKSEGSFLISDLKSMIPQPQ